MMLFEPINIGGMALNNRVMFPPMVSKRAAGQTGFVTEDIRKHVRKAGFDTPVITAGKIPTPQFANEILENEQADMVAICRAILCDHEWPVKAKQGRTKDIVKCMYCNQCFEEARKGYYTACKRWKGYVQKRADMEVGIS